MPSDIAPPRPAAIRAPDGVVYPLTDAQYRLLLGCAESGIICAPITTPDQQALAALLRRLIAEQAKAAVPGGAA